MVSPEFSASSALLGCLMLDAMLDAPQKEVAVGLYSGLDAKERYDAAVHWNF